MLEEQLHKALTYIDDKWQMQNNDYDNKSNFIYFVNTADECIELSKQNNIDIKYALHRWYNFKTSIQCENIFVEYGAVKENNVKHKEIDLYINNIPFDVKLTVYPKALCNHPYDLSTRTGKNKMIEWMYKHQSQQGRKHLKNRLFIVCDGTSQYNNLCLKSDFEQIRNKIHKFIEYTGKNGFNELCISDNDEQYIVKSDIILIKG